ncbi:MAG: hypothetical protein IJ120_02150 [Solobacterium sp.]|nr:hypothetical protein [Solobacterium sp.]
MYDQVKMNRLLLENFPELQDDFEKETSWNEGIETGSYVVYEDVFMPFIIRSFVDKDKNKIDRIMKFVEELSSSDDFEIRNLIGVTVIDNIRMYDIEKEFVPLMGSNTTKLYNEWES